MSTARRRILEGCRRKVPAAWDIPRVTETFNVFGEHEWESEQDRPGYRHRVTRIGAPLGAELLGASLYELPPGESTWPYHYEHGSEEWLLVVRGRPTLRTPHGDRQL